MSTTQDPASSHASGETSAAARGPMGFLLAAGLGAVLLLLGGLTAMRSGAAPAAPQEVPQLAVLVELKDLSPASRKAVGDLQRSLLKLPKVRVRGPMDCLLLGAVNPEALSPLDAAIPPELLPAEVQLRLNKEKQQNERGKNKKVALPTSGRFDTALEAEFEEASQFFASGGYLVPRMLSPDGKSVILRLAPNGQPTFPAGTLAAVRKLLDEQGSAFAGTTLYSKSLGLTDAGARERINEVFGVETIWVVLESANEGAFHTSPVLTGIELAVASLKDPRIRTVASDAGYFRYAYAVKAKEPNNADALNDGEAKKVPALVFVAKQYGYPLLTSEDRKRTFIEITTTAEGPEALKLERALAAKFAKIPGVKAFANRPGAKASN